MSNVIHLTAAERKLFEKIDSSLTAEWNVKDAVITYEETPEKRVARLRLLKVQSPDLRRMQLHAMKAESEEKLESIISSIDVDSLGREDFKEVFYALGPDMISRMLEEHLPKSQAAEDIEGLAGIAMIRHLLFGPQ